MILGRSGPVTTVAGENADLFFDDRPFFFLLKYSRRHGAVILLSKYIVYKLKWHSFIRRIHKKIKKINVYTILRSRRTGVGWSR